MSKNGLAYPLLLVEMADGAEWEVQPTGPDQCLFELTAIKHKWPPGQQAPMHWQTFLAWAASRREGLIPASLTWEAFKTTDHRFVIPQTAADPEPADPDGPGPSDAPFTPPAPGTG